MGGADGCSDKTAESDHICFCCYIGHFAITCVFHRMKNNAFRAAMEAFDVQSEENKALVCLFADAIGEQSDFFYQTHYAKLPAAAYCTTYVKGVTDNGADICFFSVYSAA